MAFLPNAAQSLLPVRHPDEKLGDKVFIGKYHDILMEPYELSEGEDGFDDNNEKSGSDTSIDLQAKSDGVEDDEEEDLDAYSEGNYGDLYEDKVESKEQEYTNVGRQEKKAGGKGKEVDRDDDSDDGDWMAEEE